MLSDKRMSAFALLLVVAALSGACAHRYRAEAPVEPVQTAAADDDLRDLEMMAGRNRAMLHHTWFILGLRDADAEGASDANAELPATIAARQVKLAETLAAYTGEACGQRRLPAKVRAAACDLQSRNGAAFKTPAALNVASLSSRGAAIDDMVTSWWDTVCDFAPPAETATEAVCVME